MASDFVGGGRSLARRPATQYVLPSFPPAAQPEVMRAAEKDEQYLKHVSDTCYDIARRYLGGASLNLPEALCRI
jgi:hypothetical protein